MRIPRTAAIVAGSVVALFGSQSPEILGAEHQIAAPGNVAPQIGRGAVTQACRLTALGSNVNPANQVEVIEGPKTSATLVSWTNPISLSNCRRVVTKRVRTVVYFDVSQAPNLIVSGRYRGSFSTRSQRGTTHTQIQSSNDAWQMPRNIYFVADRVTTNDGISELNCGVREVNELSTDDKGWSRRVSPSACAVILRNPSVVSIARRLR